VLVQGGCSCDLKLEGWLVVVILILVRRIYVQHRTSCTNICTLAARSR
jgi:hypothetical protein